MREWSQMTWRKTSHSCPHPLTPAAWNWPSGRFGSVLQRRQTCAHPRRPSPGPPIFTFPIKALYICFCCSHWSYIAFGFLLWVVKRKGRTIVSSGYRSANSPVNLGLVKGHKWCCSLSEGVSGFYQGPRQWLSTVADLVSDLSATLDLKLTVFFF